MNADLHVELIREIPEPQKVSNWNDFWKVLKAS